MRNDHLLAGEHAHSRAHRRKPSALRVNDLHLVGGSGVAAMTDTHGGSVQPDAHRRLRMIEPRVVEPRGDDIFGARPRQTFRNEIADQKSHQRRVAVGKVKRVGAPIGITGRGVTHMRRRHRARA